MSSLLFIFAVVTVAFLARLSSIVDALPLHAKLDPTVPLSHCVWLGPRKEFLFEWTMSQAPKYHLEMRFTSDLQRGFSAFGFSDRQLTQLVTGYPPENLACARSLWDNASPYNIDGDPFPNRPELPGQTVFTNASHASHYIMRNISLTAKSLQYQQDVTHVTNVTLLWAYMQASMFGDLAGSRTAGNGACYMANLASFTEKVSYRIPLQGSAYIKTNGVCKPYVGPVVGHRGSVKLDPTGPFVNGEYQQNNRVVMLLFGGQALLESGKAAPSFASTGRVLGGEAGNGVCLNSFAVLTARWFGFSDPIGGIAKYLVSIGTPLRPSLYVDRFNVGTNSFISFPSSAVKMNSTIMFTVEAFNYADLRTVARSKPVIVLNNGAPMFGKIYDGLSGMRTDLAFQRSTIMMRAWWVNWKNEEHSSRAYANNDMVDNGFEYAIGLADAAIDGVLAWTPVSAWRTEISVAGLSLTSGSKYHFSVRARNCAGQYTTQTTNGVTIDTVPPLPGRVRIGNYTKRGVHLTKMMIGQKLQAWWEPFVDTISGISHYEWAMGTTPKAPDATSNAGLLMGWYNVGKKLFAQNTTLSRMPRAQSLPVPRLPVGTMIYVYVRGVDLVGNYVISPSNGTQIIAN